MLKKQKSFFSMYQYFKLIFILYYIFGIDKGFLRKSVKILYIYRAYTFSLLLFANLVILYEFTDQTVTGKTWNITHILEFNITLIYNMFYVADLRSKIFERIKSLDSLLSISKSAYNELRLTVNIILFIVIFYRLGIIIPNILKLKYYRGTLSSITIHVTQLSVDLETVWRSFLLLLIAHKMNKLKDNINIYFNNNYNQGELILLPKIYDVNKYKKVTLKGLINAYITVGETTDLISTHFSFLVS